MGKLPFSSQKSILETYIQHLDGVDDREHNYSGKSKVCIVAILHIKYNIQREHVTLVHACAIAQAHTHYLVTPISLKILV